MNFGDYVKKAIDVVKLDTSAMTSLAADPKAFGMGIAILALAGVAAGIGSLNLLAIITTPIAVILLSFVGVAILHGLALLFGGKGKYTELYNVMAHSAVIQWVMIIPFIGSLLGLLASIWRIVIAVIALQTVHKLSAGQAIAVVLIPVIIIVAIFVFFFSFLLALMGGTLLGRISYQ